MILLSHATRRIVGVAATAAALLLVVSAVSTAAAATQTTITIDSNSGGETFTTTGGALCPSGLATTDFHHFGGRDVAGSFHLTKTLVCADDSGSFTIRVNAATVFGSPTDQGGWSVVGGDGAYANLRGGGSLVGTYYPGGIIDLYTGNVTK
jgi:hypothetical protein